MSLKIKFSAGFTLIELLVVMAILGLLAALGVNSFRSSFIKGRDAQRKHDLAQIQRALEMYYNDHGYYIYNDMPILGAVWQEVTEGTVYMRTMPGDPRGGDYCYEATTDGRWYKIYAKLENDQDPGIQDSGCQSGCGCDVASYCRGCQGGTPYNYKVSSSNAP